VWGVVASQGKTIEKEGKMEIVELVISCLILIGIFYVAFVQGRVTKVKNNLLGFLKDYPDVVKKHFKLKEENMRKEAEKEIEKSMEEFKFKVEKEDLTYKKSNEICVNMIIDITIFILKLYPYFRDSSFLENFISQMEHEESRKYIKKLVGYFDPIYIEEYQKYLREKKGKR
jgi:hypothetical protein